jgi:hypothetical protein
VPSVHTMATKDFKPSLENIVDGRVATTLLVLHGQEKNEVFQCYGGKKSFLYLIAYSRKEFWTILSIFRSTAATYKVERRYHLVYLRVCK